MKNKRKVIEIAIVAIVVVLFGLLAAFFLTKNQKKGGNEYAGAAGDAVTSYNGVLGYGYNIVTGKNFCYTGINVKKPILNTAKLVSQGAIRRDEYEGVETKSFGGNSISEYMSSFSNSMKISSGFIFTNSFTMNMKQEEKNKKRTMYASRWTNIYRTREFVCPNDEEEKSLDEYLQSYFTAGFKKALYNEKPANLYAQYGTHLMTDIFCGGRLELNYRYEMSESEKYSELSTSINAASMYAKFEDKAEMKEKVKNFMEKTQFHSLTTGGGTDQQFDTIDDVRERYKEWSSKVTEKNARFIDVFHSVDDPDEDLDDDTLIPLWKLVDTSTEEGKARAEELKIAYKNLVDNVNLKKWDCDPNYIKEIIISAEPKGVDARMPLVAQHVKDENILDCDLNKGINGSGNVLMGWKTTNDEDEAITDVMVTWHSSWDDPPEKWTHKGRTYKIIFIDLNYKDGKHGKYVYLWYTKDKKGDDGEILKPIRRFGIEVNNSLWFDNQNREWSRVDDFFGNKIDLNKGAGGADLFLWYKR